jgi:4-hydroxybenzoate polyprenyltransferase
MLLQILLSLRPRQWVKNLFVLPALIFSKHTFDWSYAGTALAGVACFVFASCAIYLFNDILDREFDRRHPVKSQRPLAAGKLGVSSAAIFSVMLAIAGNTWGWYLNSEFGAVVSIYTFLNALYSWKLKHVVLLDVLIVASGYLLRALGGGLVIEVYISTWFILCSFTLALFLAVTKRRQELKAQVGTTSRSILAQYSVPFLDQIISILTSATLVCYALYAMGVGEGIETARQMQWTIPFVLYGILRYLYLVYQEGEGDNPTTVIWTDRPLQATLLLWIVASLGGLYGLP